MLSTPPNHEHKIVLKHKPSYITYHKQFTYANEGNQAPNEHNLPFTQVAHAIHGDNNETDLKKFFTNILSNNSTIKLNGHINTFYTGPKIVWFAVTPEKAEHTEPVSNRYGTICIKFNLFQFLKSNPSYKMYDCGTRIFKKEHSHTVICSQLPLSIRDKGQTSLASKSAVVVSTNEGYIWNHELTLNDYSFFDHPEIAFATNELEIPLDLIEIHFCYHGFCFHEKTKKWDCEQTVDTEEKLNETIKKFLLEMVVNLEKVSQTFGKCLDKLEIKQGFKKLEKEDQDKILVHFNWAMEDFDEEESLGEEENLEPLGEKLSQMTISNNVN